jgi:hypothetical protein
MCGRRHNIHPLHWQLLVGREVRVTENPALHLVWTGGIIYMKPLPLCLCDTGFWERWICPSNDMSEASSKTVVGPKSDAPQSQPDSSSELWREANGLLMTYTRLVRHESDHRIALKLGLLPHDTTWLQWSRLLVDVDTSRFAHDPFVVAPRYHYGELSLARLNLVYRIFRRERRGFHHVERDYGAFFARHFAWILILFMYASTLLAAFQTAIAVDSAPASMQTAGYYCALAILGFVVLGVFVQGTMFAFMVLANLVWSLSQPSH